MLAAPAFFFLILQDSLRGVMNSRPPTEMVLSVCNRSEEAGPSRKKVGGAGWLVAAQPSSPPKKPQMSGQTQRL